MAFFFFSTFLEVWYRFVFWSRVHAYPCTPAFRSLYVLPLPFPDNTSDSFQGVCRLAFQILLIAQYPS